MVVANMYTVLVPGVLQAIVADILQKSDLALSHL
jgi:hypothetical protein